MDDLLEHLSLKRRVQLNAPHVHPSTQLGFIFPESPESFFDLRRKPLEVQFHQSRYSSEVEHIIGNDVAAGSIPASGTISHLIALSCSYYSPSTHTVFSYYRN